ncbi:MAG: heparinase II/III family protein, partial [Candidatus Binatia bacterium]
MIKGEFPILSLKNTNLSSPPEWNRDPLTGTVAPQVFGKAIDYRDSAKVGDIKYLWELNRHLQFPVLAQAYYLSGESRYLEAIQTQLDSWLDQCPYPSGPNWISSLELGIRLINWSLTWQLLRLKRPEKSLFESPDLEGRWLDSIYRHAHFIQGYFSRYSSANNHLIGEAAGLFIASMTWPFWKDMKDWGRISYRILVEEALKQNALDGVNREQTVSYQQFVLDFMLLAVLAGKTNAIEFPKEYWARMEALMEFIAAIMDVAGHVPMIGDADDALVARLSQEVDFCPYRSLLATGTLLFSRADFRSKAGKLDDKTRWLLGGQTESFE